MSATLTDRYIAATVKSLPASVQEDVRTELIELALSNGVSQDTLRILAVIFGFGVVGTSCWDIADGWWKTRSTSQQIEKAPLIT